MITPTKEDSHNVTLKTSMTEWGTYNSIRLLKGRSNLSEAVLENINKVLELNLVCVKPVQTTVHIGDNAEQKVFSHLTSISQVNSSFQVFDTSSKTGHGDLEVIYKNKRICIEVKCYTKPVPLKEVDKYHRSLALAEYDAGLILQLETCGYAAGANIGTPIDIRMHEGKPSAYLTAIDLKLLYSIINLLIATCDKEESSDKTDLDKKTNALIAIHQKIEAMRSCIRTQQKAIEQMETTIEEIAKLSCN